VFCSTSIKYFLNLVDNVLIETKHCLAPVSSLLPQFTASILFKQAMLKKDYTLRQKLINQTSYRFLMNSTSKDRMHQHIPTN
jgi:hypothetical protein